MSKSARCLALALLVSCAPDPEAPPGEPSLVCGEGTVEEAGVCVPEEGEPGLGGILVSLPLPQGTAGTLGQSFHGFTSHSGNGAYAVDFPMAEGALIVAARDGRVREVREDSDSGCGDASCADQANYVLVDHGDGTVGSYYHLQFEGALVEAGDVVCAGEPLGLAGSTGFATGPHLHFEIDDLFGHSVPLRFEELLEESDGLPVSGLHYVSENEAPDLCDAPGAWSDCPGDVFAHLGVLVDPGLPCSVAPYEEPYAIEGELFSGETVLLATYGQPHSGGEAEWSYDCVVPDADGSFSLELLWSETQLGGWGFFTLASADPACYAYQGWSKSILVILED